MKNLQIWGTGWAASWAFFKVIEKIQGIASISFRILSFASANSLSKQYKLETNYMIMKVWIFTASDHPIFRF